MKVYLIVEDIDLGYHVLSASLDHDRAQKLLQGARDKRAAHLSQSMNAEAATKIVNTYIRLEEQELT